MHRSPLIVLAAAGIFLLICASLIRSILLSRQAHRALEEQQQEVEQLQKTILELENTVEQATSSFELERRVREELGRQREGEQVIELRLP
jgi:cell division protein FtsB